MTTTMNEDAIGLKQYDKITRDLLLYYTEKRYRNFATTCLENDKFMNSYKRIYPDRNPLEGFEIKNFVKDHKSNNWLKILQKYLQNPTLTVRDISYLV